MSEPQVHGHQMVVGAPGDQVHALCQQGLAEGLGVFHDAALILFELGGERLAEADRLAGDDVHLVSGGTDNHLMTVDLRGTGVTGKQLEARLDEVNITANKNTVPNDPEKPTVTSGVRIGTPAVTTRGFGVAEMKEIAGFIAGCVFDFEGKKEEIKAGVAALTARFPLYE